MKSLSSRASDRFAILTVKLFEFLADTLMFFTVDARAVHVTAYAVVPRLWVTVYIPVPPLDTLYPDGLVPMLAPEFTYP